MLKSKHKTLSLSEEKDILKKFDQGERIIDLASEYGVSRATIHDIQVKTDKIKFLFFKNSEDSKNPWKMH